ncbi:hypothetical protein WOLCODRAFT_126072 [Wolfiporia cocos MD-104 SS10]|uniref:rRNA-processing protein EFG1 n=1 Tax=Wolfiporia cocos (strain MD-104) TaxID=742152 RepID=A0A2H3J781_WOLCO|nr:hypothetical protein WOLCODRAFT_126072 [Wolfiporia cocos MD-104 SS10]
MAPIRNGESSDASTSKSSTHSNNPAHKSKYSRKPNKQRPTNDHSASAALPGVQKIKAALRQTRRLLAKDNLAADVRAKTERRLKALEADLAQAELARKERAMSTRYHAVKFFERQKVTRRIKQVKRQLSESTSKDAVTLDKKERKKLTKKLEELRVDLNYTLHYPKLRKYISLFPPELRQQPHEHLDPFPHLYLSSNSSSAEGISETDAQREEVRAWVREQMAAGQMSAEPEVDGQVGKQEAGSKKASASLAGGGMASKARNLDHTKDATAAESRGSNAAKREAGLEEDAFFGDDDSSEEEASDGDEDVDPMEED